MKKVNKAEENLEKAVSSIHIINADIEEVRNHLAYCQMFSDEFELEKFEVLKDKLENEQSTFLKTLKVVKFIKKQKERKVRFYCIERDSNISIFSEHFTFDNVFQIAREYFSDLNNYILAFSVFEGKKLRIDLVKEGEQLTSFIYNASEEGNLAFDFNLLIFEKSGILNNPSELEKIFHTDSNEVTGKLESLFDLPLSLEVKDIDINSSNVYLDEYFV